MAAYSAAPVIGRRDVGLRVEKVLVPQGFWPQRLGAQDLRPRDYVLTATHQDGRWTFNPDALHEVWAGQTLIVMATPQIQARLEAALAAA